MSVTISVQGMLKRFNISHKGVKWKYWSSHLFIIVVALFYDLRSPGKIEQRIHDSIPATKILTQWLSTTRVQLSWPKKLRSNQALRNRNFTGDIISAQSGEITSMYKWRQIGSKIVDTLVCAWVPICSVWPLIWEQGYDFGTIPQADHHHEGAINGQPGRTSQSTDPRSMNSKYYRHSN